MSRKPFHSSIALVAAALIGVGVPPGCDRQSTDEPEQVSVERAGEGEVSLEDYAVGSLPGSAGGSPSGAANYSIPLELPKGVGGFAPSAAITYSSGGGDGLLGPGFTLSGLESSITRCPRTWLDDGQPAAVQFDNDDALCLDGGRLTLHSGQPFAVGAVYRQLREGFRRVEVIAPEIPDAAFPGKVGFKVTDRSGVQHFYDGGWEARTRHDSTDFAWARTRSVDTFGNEITYAYAKDPGSVPGASSYGNDPSLLTSVTYAVGGGNSHQVELEYEPSDISRTGYFYGAFQDRAQRLRGIVTSTSGTTLRDYSFTYEPSQATGRGLLRQVDSCGHRDGEVLCVPPTVFAWEETDPFELGLPPYPIAGQDTEYSDDSWIPQRADAGLFVIADIDRNGDQEMVYRSEEAGQWMRWSIDEELSGIVISSGNQLEVHQSNVLRPLAVDFDNDPESEILVPECELEPTGDEPPSPACRVEHYTYDPAAVETSIPYSTSLAILDDSSGDGLHLSRTALEVDGQFPNRVYMIPPSADLDGDGYRDLVVCGGDEYESATWRLLRNRANATGVGQPSFRAWDLRIPCDAYDHWEGPSDIDGDGTADLLLAMGPNNPVINYGNAALFERVDIPTERLTDLASWEAYSDPIDGDYHYYDWLRPTGLPVDNIAAFLSRGCAWFSAELISGDVESVVAASHFSRYLASIRGQGTHRWGDFDGDGNVDVLRLDIATNGVTTPQANEPEDLEYLADLCDSGVLPVSAPQPKLKIWRNGGGTFSPSRVIHTYVSTTVPEIAKDVGLFSVNTVVNDFNQDGTSDIEFQHGDPGGDCTRRRHYAHSDSTTTEESAYSFPNCDVETATFEGATVLERPFRNQFLAQIRDGRTAIVRLDQDDPGPGAGANYVPPTIYSARIMSNRPIDKIAAITDGLGERAEFEYAVSANNSIYQSYGACDEEYRCLIGGAMWLLEYLRHDAGMVDETKLHETSFTYADGRFGRSGRGFLGFEEVQSVTREDDGSSAALPIGRQLTQYDLSYDPDYRDYPFSSAPKVAISEQLVTDANGTLQRAVARSRVGRTVKPSPGAAGYFVAPQWTASERALFPADVCGSVDVGCSASVVQQILVPGLGGSGYSDVEKDSILVTTTTDAYGTVTSKTSEHNGATEESSFSDFVYDDPSWILGLPQHITHKSSSGGESLTREVELAYDLPTRAVDYSIREPNAPQYWLRSDYTYDSFGNVTQVVGENDLGEQTWNAFQYDATAGVAIEKLGNALGHWRNVQEEPGTGAILASDEPNGNYVENEYDAMGRLTGSRRRAFFPSGPTDGNDLSISHHWDDSVENSVYRVNNSVQTGGQSRTYFDRLGREVRACWLGMSPSGGAPVLEEQGEWICQDTFYDIRGNVREVTVPFYEGGTPAARQRFTYDNVGRLIKSESAAGRLTFHEYGFNEQITVDADGNRQVTVFDNQGRLWFTLDALGTTTCYEFGPFGQAERVTRNCFNPAAENGQAGPPAIDDLEFQHDLYGNLTWSYDPDRGETSHEYSPGFFELESTTDANGDKISLEHDILGRTTAIALPEGNVNITWDVGKIGLVDQISGPGFTYESFEYDQFLRTTSVQTIVDGDSYAIGYTYSGGQLQGIDYPEGVSVDYAYDGAGYLREAYVGGQLAWRANSASLLGMIERASFGNEVENVRRHDWDGLLVRSTTVSPTAPGGEIEAMDYDWNHLAQLRSRTDTLTSQSQIFTYDVQSRLIGTQTTKGGSAVKNESYDYDRFGNLLSKTGVGNYNYSYEEAGNRLKDIAGVSYFWDAAGQLERRGEEEFTWTGSGRLEEYSSNKENLRHLYAGSGARVRTHDLFRNEQTTFVGGLYQETVEEEKRTVHRFSIPATTGVVAQLTRVVPDGAAPVDTIEYIHPDHLGSASLTTNAGGTVERAVMYDPWGATQKRADWTAPFKEGSSNTNVTTDYTGHDERLGNDLVNMNARYFDTRIGRSISADTIVPNPLDSQSFNRFSYVVNNPLALTDPTGHAPESNPHSPDTCNGNGCSRDIVVHTGGENPGGSWNPNGSLTGGESAADQIAATYGGGLGPEHLVANPHREGQNYGISPKPFSTGNWSGNRPLQMLRPGFPGLDRRASRVSDAYAGHLDTWIWSPLTDVGTGLLANGTALAERAYTNATRPDLGLLLAMDDVAGLLVDTYMALDATVNHANAGEYGAAASSHLTAAKGAWQLVGMVMEGIRMGSPAKGGGKLPPGPERSFVVDPKGNTLVQPPGGKTVGSPDGRFVEARYPNGSPAQQLHGPHGHMKDAHGHGFKPGPGKNTRGPSLDRHGNEVDVNSPEAHWPVNQ